MVELLPPSRRESWQSSMAGIYFVCRICPAQFNRLMDLEQHMVEAHNAYIPKYLEGGRE